MATLRWAELCNQVERDELGRISIIGIYDRMLAPSFPAKVEDAWVVCKIEGYPRERIRVEISLIGPDGKHLAPTASAEAQVGPAGVVFVPGQLTGVVIPSAGRYELRIQPAGNPSSSILIDAVKTRD